MARRTIARVEKDWDPPSPRTTPVDSVRGRTADEVFRNLNRLPGEWGEGGGRIRADEIAAGTSTDLTVQLHANLVLRLPVWSDYAQGSASLKRAWDRMIAKLRAHEQRHVDIAIEEADACALDLVGREISEIADRVTHYNREMARRQRALDTSTEHGARAGVPYGDVILDDSGD